MVSRGEGSQGAGWKGGGIEKYRLVVQNSHEDVKYSIGDIVINMVIIMYSAHWVLEIRG